MDYRQTYNGEIFQKSQCIWKENTTVSFLRILLGGLGYEPQDPSQFIWAQGSRRVLLGIVDDVQGLGVGLKSEPNEPAIESLTTSDIVVTDSWMNLPLPGKVLRLPDSWFGIYSYTPNELTAIPEYLYSFAVNRINYDRMITFLNLSLRNHISDRALINFNCAQHTDSPVDQHQNTLWNETWNNFPDYEKERYQKDYEKFAGNMPWRNHQFTIEETMNRSLVNIVMETYMGDDSVAISEKTFRALVTPRAWRILGGTHTVSRLRQLGFDVLDDRINHDETDHLKMVEDKIDRFIWSCCQTWRNLDWSRDSDRIKQAAIHNQRLLAEFRSRWPQDFADWLPKFINAVK